MDQKLISRAQLEATVARVYKGRFQVGEFNPHSTLYKPLLPDDAIYSTAHQQVSLESSGEQQGPPPGLDLWLRSTLGALPGGALQLLGCSGSRPPSRSSSIYLPSEAPISGSATWVKPDAIASGVRGELPVSPAASREPVLAMAAAALDDWDYDVSSLHEASGGHARVDRQRRDEQARVAVRG